ncbi:MAG TPA: hypothetical protein VMD75_02135 [Candidatus Binataceae bacterium]|nr:hypothetical protein [Candidatus Binataceae bacterium]
MSDRNSLLSVAQTLDSTASQVNGEAQPFAFEVRFAQPLMPRSENPQDFVMKGLFARSCDASDYLALGWGYSGQENDRAYAAIIPLDQPPDCAGKPAVFPAIDVIDPPSIAESAADHPEVQGWTVDFPQIDEALKKNGTLFAHGLEALDVTTARRLRLDDTRPVGCLHTAYSRSGHHRRPEGIRLEGVNDTRAVVELIEAGRPDHKANLAGYCTAGHYLILDAATSEPLEHGSYQRCEFFASGRI